MAGRKTATPEGRCGVDPRTRPPRISSADPTAVATICGWAAYRCAEFQLRPPLPYAQP